MTVATSPSPDDYAAAGLYDPAAPGAIDRLALLDWLSERGFTVEQMQAAGRAGALPALAGDALLMAGATLTLRDISERTGICLEELDRVLRASGFAAIDPDERSYGERDVSTFVLFHTAAELFSQDELLHFTRVLGSSVARIAEAANSLFLEDVERPLRGTGGGELDLARANLVAVDLVADVSSVVDTLLRFHLRQTTDRFRNAYRAGAGTCVDLTVGFVDLCGFTARSGELSTEQLAGVIRQFEAKAYDIVSGHGGRVVKLIGDEVMFTAFDASTACAIANALVEAFTADELTPRGGLAYGSVLARSGDYYGPIVNLASRIADLAVPGEVLATPELASAAANTVQFVPAGRRMLKGFPDPVELVSLAR